jgi:hypothetical protein
VAGWTGRAPLWSGKRCGRAAASCRDAACLYGAEFSCYPLFLTARGAAGGGRLNERVMCGSAAARSRALKPGASLRCQLADFEIIEL